MKHIVVGTAGHIDHGKSALVLALTGTDPDRLKEEKERGITIDLGFAHWRASDLTVALVDVPGHERFVKNMLAGVGGIDAVLLVVAADESIMPQTREHFDICRLLRVPAGIVAVTKADLVDDDTLELVKLEIRELVRGSFLESAPVIPVSSRTGSGLDSLRAALVDIGARVSRPSSEGVVRLPVDRAFSVKGFGTVVTGTLVSGSLRVDDELAVLPVAIRVKVRGLQVHGEPTEVAVAGQRAAVNLGGIEVTDLARGDTLAVAGTVTITRVVDVRIETLESVKPLRHGARIRFHHATSEALGRVAISSASTSEGNLTGTASEIGPGQSAFARIRLESDNVLTRGDRFILRAYSPPTTIAGGVVLDPLPPKTGIRTPAGLARFARLDTDDAPPGDLRRGQRAVLLMLDEAGLTGLPVSELVSRGGLSPAEGSAMADTLTQRHDAVRIGDSLFADAAIAALGTAVKSLLGAYHRAQPLSDGIPREEVRERLCGHAAAGVFERVLANLAGAHEIALRDRLALSDHRVALSDQDARARDLTAKAFLDAGFAPPLAGDVAASIGVPREAAERLVTLLVRQKILVKVETLIFHAETLDRLKRDIAAMKSSAGAGGLRLDVAAFKARYGITRKYAIPLLEYLDRERVTRRVGEVRVVI